MVEWTAILYDASIWPQADRFWQHNSPYSTTSINTKNKQGAWNQLGSELLDKPKRILWQWWCDRTIFIRSRAFWILFYQRNQRLNYRQPWNILPKEHMPAINSYRVHSVGQEVWVWAIGIHGFHSARWCWWLQLSYLYHSQLLDELLQFAHVSIFHLWWDTSQEKESKKISV